jgi:uncharacterized protein YqhQ
MFAKWFVAEKWIFPEFVLWLDQQRTDSKLRRIDIRMDFAYGLVFLVCMIFQFVFQIVPLWITISVSTIYFLMSALFLIRGLARVIVYKKQYGTFE